MYEVGGLEPGNYSAYAEPLDNPLTPGAAPTLQAIYPGKTPVENFTTRFAVQAAQPESLTVAKTAGENQTGSIGEALSAPLEVEVRDGTGKLAAGVTVRFAATRTPPAICSLRITFNSRVRRVAGGIITTVAGNGVMGSGGDNGPAVNASVFLPAAVVFDSTANLHIADSGLVSRIRAIRAPIP